MAEQSRTSASPPEDTTGGGAAPGAGGTDSALAAAYPGLVCDLDGVVYRGSQAVAHAAAALAAVRDSGGRIIFATNNASRPPADVAEVLRGHGVTLEDTDVLTSSVAGARYLAGELAAGSSVLAVGGPGVGTALDEAGLHAVFASEPQRGEVDAVLQGYGAQVTATDLAEAAYAVQAGARWVATNDDRTLPTDRGVAPGNGSLVAAVRTAVDVDATVVGKPGPLLYELAAQALGTSPEQTLGIGDRLETDVAGAHAAGMDALHVLTGVHGPADLVQAPKELRPRYVAADLRALLGPYAEPQQAADGWTIGGWRAHWAPGADGRVEWLPLGEESAELTWIEKLRVALHVLWAALDDGTLSPDEAVAALPARQ